MTQTMRLFLLQFTESISKQLYEFIIVKAHFNTAAEKTSEGSQMMTRDELDVFINALLEGKDNDED